MTFDIDANGIVNVSAKDKGTGREQKITIQSSSGMSKEDIDRMVKEAEAHAAEDKAQKDAADAKNEAEQTVYQAEKTCKDLDGKVDESLIKDVRAANEKLQAQLKDNADASTLKESVENVRQALYKLSSAAYQSGAQQQSGGGAQEEPKKNDDGTIDAEYTEMNNDKK